MNSFWLQVFRPIIGVIGNKSSPNFPIRLFFPFLEGNFLYTCFPLLTHFRHWHRIPPNMYKHGFGTMSMTTTSGFSREGFVIGQK